MILFDLFIEWLLYEPPPDNRPYEKQVDGLGLALFLIFAALVLALMIALWLRP